jgi:hypothetical protein
MALVLEVESTGELIPDRKSVEAEHGPIIGMQHPDDGAVFGFKTITPEIYALYRARVTRGDDDAMSKLLQERACWPSREAWNKYVSGAVFQELVFAAGYRRAQGGAKVRECDADEIPDDGNLEWKWLTNRKGDDGVTFGFRKPGRAEVKLFQSQIAARQHDPKAPDPIEAVLRSCGTPEFGAWLTANPFGVDTFGEAFVGSYGMTEARVSPK